MRREPQTFEQCIGCAGDVAVYSDRQRVRESAEGPAGVLCSPCRRTHTRETRRDRAAASKARRAAAPPPAPKVCTCEAPRPMPPPHASECRICWHPIKTEGPP